MLLDALALRLFFTAKVTKPSSAEDAAPKWNLLIPFGPHYRQDIPGGVYDFTKARLQTMIDNWVRAGKPRIRGDYFHYGGTDVPNVPLESKVASGYGVDLRLSADGLEVLIDWKERARKFITADELSQLSPEVYFNPVDRNTGERQGPTLTSFGLLNDPSFENLPRVAAARPPAVNEETTMLKLLLAHLGLAEGATEADVTRAIEAHKAKLSAAETAKTELAAKLAKVEGELAEKMKLSAAGDDAMKAIRDDHAKLAKVVEQMEADKKTAAIDALIVRLERGEGCKGTHSHITAAQKDAVKKFAATLGVDEAWKHFSQFKAVPIGELGHGGSGGGDVEMTKAEATRKLAELADAAQADAKKAGEKLTATQAYARVKAAHPDIAKAAFAQN